MSKNKSKKKSDSFFNAAEGDLSKANPFTQGKMLMENIDAIKSNVKETVKLIMPFAKQISPKEAPCEVAKFVANKVCSMKLDSQNLSDLFSYQKMMKALEDTQSKLNDLTVDIKSNIGEIDLSGKVADLVDSSSKLVKQAENPNKKVKQTGGGVNKYKYIINPLTNRKVKIDSRLGKKILLEYVRNL
tara:strand:+ start:234 stop:794 length:561 start_codon:yes stop_codon:yes gene_type:complete